MFLKDLEEIEDNIFTSNIISQANQSFPCHLKINAADLRSNKLDDWLI